MIPTELALGWARRDITPDGGFRPQWLDGYGNRDHPAVGVYLPLSARALCLRQGPTAALIITAEVCAFGMKETRRLKLRLAQAAGLPYDAIVLATTHTHCGPRVGDLVMPGEKDADYVAWFEDQVVAAGEEAARDPQPVTLRHSEAVGTLGVNRRGFGPNGATMLPNHAGKSDSTVHTLWFDAPSGENLASLTTYACHSTSRGGYRIGGDYPGFLMRDLDEALGGMSAFVLGCAGDQRPCFTNAEGRFRQAEESEVEEAGAKLAADVLTARETAVEVPPGPLRVSRALVPLPLLPVPSADELRRVAAEDAAPLKRAWAEGQLSTLEQSPLPTHADFEVQAVHLGPRLALVFWAGEMVVDYALWLKEIAGSRAVFPMGYSNGSVGYVPSRRIYPEGGYEVDGSYFYYGQPAPFAVEVEDHVRAATRAVLQ